MDAFINHFYLFSVPLPHFSFINKTFAGSPVTLTEFSLLPAPNSRVTRHTYKNMGCCLPFQ